MKFEERFDWQLFFIICCFIAISSVALFSAQQSTQYNENFVLKQLVWYGVGGVVIGFMMIVDPEDFKKVSWYLYGFGLVLLIALILAPPSIAPVIKGQKSWFTLPGLSLQPAELVKIFTILVLGRIAVNHNSRSSSSLKSDFMLLLKLGAAAGVPFLLVMQQPDLGTGARLFSNPRWFYFNFRNPVENHPADFCCHFCAWDKPDLAGHPSSTNSR